MRLQLPASAALLRPSAISVPGSGIFGILLCTISVRGSHTRSYMGEVFGTPLGEEEVV